MTFLPFPDDDLPPRLEWPDEVADDRSGRLAQAVASRIAGGMNGGIGRITVRAQNGVVVLDGHVESAATASKIGELAWSVPGVADVCNSLDHPQAWPAH